MSLAAVTAPAEATGIAEAVRWWITLEIVGLLAFPLVALALSRLPDRGYAFTKLIGIVLIAWAVWFAGMLTPLEFSRAANTAAALLLGVISAWLLLRRQRRGLRELTGFVRERWRWLVCAEALFLVAFVAWTVVRWHDPSIFNNEKVMDFAFFNSFVLNHDVPAVDPFLAGETINYYYFGYAIYASLCQLAGVDSAIGYNLANVTIFALTATAAFALVAYLAALSDAGVRRLRGPALGAGLLGTFLVVLAGNVHPIKELLAGRVERTYDWWTSSRLIVDAGAEPNGTTVNEYPAFSMVLNDLHPHLMALPLVILALGLMVATLMADRERVPWAPLLLLGFVVGALAATNTWDVLALGALAAGTIVVWSLRRVGGRRRDRLRRAPVAFAVFAAPAVLAFLPFHLGFVPFAGAETDSGPGTLDGVPVLGALVRVITDTVGVNAAPRTAEGFLTLFGILLVAGGALLVAALSRSPLRRSAVAWIAAGATVVVAVVLATVLDAPLAALLLPLGCFAAALAARSGSAGDAIALSLLALGAFMALATEFFFLRDSFDSRYNTLFKIYYEVWVFWGLAGAYGVWSLAVRTAGALRATPPALRAARVVVVSLVVLAGSLFLALAPAARGGLAWLPLVDFEPFPALHRGAETKVSRGLDGLAYLKADVPDDHAAIGWLRANAIPGEGLETTPGEGAYPAGVATYATGQPTILGTPTREMLWRARQPKLRDALDDRERDKRLLWKTTDPRLAERILDRYDIRYVIVGDGEKTRDYGPVQLLKYVQFMNVIYRSQPTHPDPLAGTTIYERR